MAWERLSDEIGEMFGELVEQDISPVLIARLEMRRSAKAESIRRWEATLPPARKAERRAYKTNHARERYRTDPEYAATIRKRALERYHANKAKRITGKFIQPPGGGSDKQNNEGHVIAVQVLP